MRPRTADRRHATARGFTLIEIMVVVTILGLLATLVVTSVTDSGDRAREQKASTDLQIIAAAVRGYRADRGRLPTLDELTARDAKGRRYLEELGRDPWERDYLLRTLADRREWEVVSGGPNGEIGDDDDLSSRRAQ